MLKTVGIVAVTGLFFRFTHGIYKEYELGSSLFSWHPFLMILGQFIGIESILIYTYLPRGYRVTIHGIIAGIAMSFFIGGFYAIYQNKNNNNKPHFTSWHGLLGLLTVAQYIAQSLFGSLLKYGKPLLQFILRKNERIKFIKICHKFYGSILMAFSFIGVLLVISNYFAYIGLIVIPSLALILPVSYKVLCKSLEKKEKK